MENENLVSLMEYAQKLKKTLDRVHLFARESLQQERRVMKHRYDAQDREVCGGELSE